VSVPREGTKVWDRRAGYAVHGAHTRCRYLLVGSWLVINLPAARNQLVFFNWIPAWKRVHAMGQARVQGWGTDLLTLESMVRRTYVVH